MKLCKIIYYSLAALHVSSDIFGHRQEHQNCITASGVTNVCRCRLAATYVGNTRSCNTVQMLLTMSENIAQNMQTSQGIINFPTQLHLVGYFRTFLFNYLCPEKRTCNKTVYTDIVIYTRNYRTSYREAWCERIVTYLKGKYSYYSGNVYILLSQ